jgi:SulP family sulfate permease
MLAVVLSFLFYVVTASTDVRVLELFEDEEGDFEVKEAPKELPDDKATLITIHGSKFFAAAYKMGDQLPSANKSQHAVVIIRMRGREKIGSTFIEILERYSATLKKNGGKVMLSGVCADVYDQLEKTEMIELLGEENIFPDSSKLLYSSKQALKAANAWLEDPKPEMDNTAEEGE